MSHGLDPAQNLPQGVCITDADCHLYRVGLSLYKPHPNCQRSLLIHILFYYMIINNVHYKKAHNN